jgi:predicted alpha/beta hydrolase family esterase
VNARPPRRPGSRRIGRDTGRALYPFAPRTPVLVVPGLNDSGPQHWQSQWQAKHPSFRRVVQDDFATPSLERWSARIADAVDACDAPPIVAAHSFGCLATVHAVLQRGRMLAGVLLVAPADPERFAIAAHLPPQRLPFPSTLVASTNDPWIRFVAAGALAAAWGSRFVGCVDGGHINAESGHGMWHAGMSLLRDVAERAAAVGTVRAQPAIDLHQSA